MNDFEIIKYKDKDIELDVNVSLVEKTAWITINDLCLLFNRERTIIAKIIKELLKETSLQSKRTSAKIAHVQLEGDRIVQRNIKAYNLDFVMSVGLRLKSEKGIQLKKYIDEKISSKANSNNNVIIYNNGNINLSVDVSPEEDTVWLNVNQIAMLFDTTTNNIYMHIKSILAEGELEDSLGKDSLLTGSLAEESSVTGQIHKKVASVGLDGKNYVMDYYNLDMILAVGYRTKSKRAIEFRKWASSVLKQYLFKGYVIDDKRVTISKENFIQLENDVANIKNEIADIKEKVFIEPVKERLFFEGKYFDAYEFLCSLLCTAKRIVLIIDPYFDFKSLRVLNKISKNVLKTICLSHKAPLNKEDVNKFEKQYGKINIIYNDSFHDRFLIIDDSECYSLGASINYFGKRVFAINKIEDKEITQTIINKVYS